MRARWLKPRLFSLRSGYNSRGKTFRHMTPVRPPALKFRLLLLLIESQAAHSWPHASVSLSRDLCSLHFKGCREDSIEPAIPSTSHSVPLSDAHFPGLGRRLLPPSSLERATPPPCTFTAAPAVPPSTPCVHHPTGVATEAETAQSSQDCTTSEGRRRGRRPAPGLYASIADALSQGHCGGLARGPHRSKQRSDSAPSPPGDVTARTAHTSAQHRVSKQCDASCGPAADIK